MNRIPVQAQHLAAVERQVTNGEQRLIWQRELIAVLEKRGRPIQREIELLRVFEATQLELVAKRDRISEELAATSMPVLQVA